MGPSRLAIAGLALTVASIVGYCWPGDPASAGVSGIGLAGLVAVILGWAAFAGSRGGAIRRVFAIFAAIELVVVLTAIVITVAGLPVDVQSPSLSLSWLQGEGELPMELTATPSDKFPLPVSLGVAVGLILGVAACVLAVGGVAARVAAEPSGRRVVRWFARVVAVGPIIVGAGSAVQDGRWAGCVTAVLAAAWLLWALKLAGESSLKGRFGAAHAMVT